MKFKAALILIGFIFSVSLLFVGRVATEVQNVSVQANDRSSGVTQPRASAQGPIGLASAQDNHSSTTPLHLEPLFLFLMGTTLFLLGSAIKLVLARKLDPKHLGAARKPPSPQW